MTVYVLALIACLVLSGIFSASEMAISSANHVRLENAAESGDKRAKLALHIVDRYDATLSAILIGNNLVNITASSLSSIIALLIAAGLGASTGLCTTLATVAVTVLVIIFGETVPKIVASKNANRMSLSFAGFLRGLEILLRPLVWCAVGLAGLITKPLRGEADDTDSQDEAVDQLQSIIETAEDEDVLDEDESELLQNALDFSDISVGEVMTARVDMVALDIDDDWDTILKIIDEAPYSRLPVYEGDTDNIIGVLHLNVFFRALLDGSPVDIRSLLTQPCWVYKTVKLPAVLAELRKRKTHLAIVTDEYGGTAGVVSLEDVLETIVGEIWDETDKVEPEVVKTAEGELEIDGDMSIGDFLELVGLDEEAFDFESDTVGGWTMEMFGGFPSPNDSFTYGDLTVTVLETQDKRVEKVAVRHKHPKAGTGSKPEGKPE